MSDLKSTKSWHIQNLIDVEDDCQVVLLEDALVLEHQRDQLKEINAELLDALQRLLNMEADEHLTPKGVRNLARAAITKATGE